jgi:hypothetical protein
MDHKNISLYAKLVIEGKKARKQDVGNLPPTKRLGF